MARDYGFAPNPFYGFCTLATCKPVIRKMAVIGDWVIGTGSKSRNREGFIVFAMRINEVFSFSDYWHDLRFLSKRPNMNGSKKQAFGDNIYHKNNSNGSWMQEDSHHSLSDGTPNSRNIDHDTKVDRVLISTEYFYWGGYGPKIPKRFRGFKNVDICAKRGHKNFFPEEMTNQFVTWLFSLDEAGYCYEPREWINNP